MRDSRTAGLVRAALAAALIGVSALVAVPIGPVPVTLQVLAVAVTVLLLSPRESLAALGTYVALGAIGLPVFSAGSGGVGVLLGPTGGFLVGFVVGAPLGSLVRTRLSGGPGVHRLGADTLGVAVMVAVSYMLGLVQLTMVTSMTAVEGLGVAVVPFIVPDAIKVLIALIVTRSVRRASPGVLQAGCCR
ncbi:MAG: biotin transporter BioY [Coriobacteriia bacterium]|nr:biotin transporter BioY [Coriobacteriia bacterium]